MGLAAAVQWYCTSGAHVTCCIPSWLWRRLTNQQGLVAVCDFMSICEWFLELCMAVQYYYAMSNCEWFCGTVHGSSILLCYVLLDCHVHCCCFTFPVLMRSNLSCVAGYDNTIHPITFRNMHLFSGGLGLENRDSRQRLQNVLMSARICPFVCFVQVYLLWSLAHVARSHHISLDRSIQMICDM